MNLTPKAGTNVRDGFKLLMDLSPGKVVHFCLVRVGGEADQAVRVVFGPRSEAATKETFSRAWLDDDDVKGSARPSWFVVRGAVTLRADKVTVVPAIRGNRVLAAAELKKQIKDLRASMSGAGLSSAPLKKVIDGKFVRAEDTTKLVSSDAPPASAEDVEEEEDAQDLKELKGAKDADVVALVARYKKISLKSALAKAAAARDDDAKVAAAKALTAVRDEIVDALEDAAKLDKSLRAKTLGSTRFKDSLTSLKELTTRGTAALESAETALGHAIGGAHLAPESRKGKADPILDTLRKLVSSLNAAADDKKIGVLADLYFAADTWLKIAGEGSAKRTRSEEVDLTMKTKVQDVYAKAARQLAERAGVTINNLPSWLERNHGKGMTAHGYHLDVEQGLAKWMTADQREVFRLHVKGGKLYQYNWWTWSEAELWGTTGKVDLSKKKLVMADSGHSENAAVITAGYSGFVMSMSGDLYLTKQFAGGVKVEGGSVYHSSYMAGLPVLMAGEVLVKGGTVKRVNTRSGHYQPSAPMVVRFLKQLQLLGVKVDEVADFDNKNEKSVQAYLAEMGDRLPSADDYAKNEKDTAEYQQKIFFAQMMEAQTLEIAEARRRLASLESATVALQQWLAREATGTAQPRGVTEQKVRFEVKRTSGQATASIEALAKIVERADERLEQRRVNHEALKGKDKDAQAEKADGYVNALTTLKADANLASAKLTTALQAAAKVR